MESYKASNLVCVPVLQSHYDQTRVKKDKIAKLIEQQKKYELLLLMKSQDNEKIKQTDNEKIKQTDNEKIKQTDNEKIKQTDNILSSFQNCYYISIVMFSMLLIFLLIKNKK
jgi:hypothetical protein